MKLIYFLILFFFATAVSGQLSVFGTVGGSAYDTGFRAPSGLSTQVGFMLRDRATWYGSFGYDSYKVDYYVRQWVASAGFGGQLGENAMVTIGLTYRGNRSGDDGQLGFRSNLFLTLKDIGKASIIAVGTLGVTNIIQWSAGVGVSYKL